MKKSLFCIALITSVIIAITFGGCVDAIGGETFNITTDTATVTYYIKSIGLDISACETVTNFSRSAAATKSWGPVVFHDIDYGPVDALQKPTCEYSRTERQEDEDGNFDGYDHFYTLPTSRVEGWSVEQTVSAGTTVRLIVKSSGTIFNAKIRVNDEDCASADEVNGVFDFTCEIVRQ